MAASDRVGERFGRYRIDERISHGPIAEVYRAVDTDRDRTIALKVLKPELTADDDFRAQFLRDSRTAARLGEPHVIPVHDWGEIDGSLYVDMRFVDGETLQSRIGRQGPLQPDVAVSIIEQAGAALDAAHGQGLIHRNVSPSSILLADGDFAYLVDFGIDPDAAAGAHASASPNFVAGSAETDSATPSVDVFGLAAVLSECLTGRAPDASGVSGDSSVDELIPDAFRDVVERGMRTDPSRRYSSAGALARAARQSLDREARPLAGTSPPDQLSVTGPTEPLPDMPAATAAPYQPGLAYATAPIGPPRTDMAYGAPPPPPPSQSPARRSGLGGVGAALLGALAVLLIGVLALGGYWLLSSRDDDSADRSNPAAETVTQTVPAPPGAPQQPAAEPGPPAGAVSCGALVAAGNAVTSCPFAVAVRDEYLRTGVKGASRVIVAYSAVTGSAYTMSCGQEGAVVACRGGNDAVVYIY